MLQQFPAKGSPNFTFLDNIKRLKATGGEEVREEAEECGRYGGAPEGDTV
jgi:hypothetical protein